MYVSNIKRLDMFRRRSTWLFPIRHSISEHPDARSSLTAETSSSTMFLVNEDPDTPRHGPGQLPSRTVNKALKRLEKFKIAMAKDTREFPPNGEWTDHTFKITNEFGFPYMFITAEEVRSCFFRRKRIDFKVMTPEGHHICSMYGKISIRHFLTIGFEPSFSIHGKIIQPGFRPFYYLYTAIDIPLYRIEPIHTAEMTCYSPIDLPSEYLVYTMDGFERNAKAGTHWERYKLPDVYSKEVYKRTSGYGVAFGEESALDAWQRLLLLALHLTIKVIREEYFYDRGDFVTGYGHPERSFCDKYFNSKADRPKMDAGPLQPKYYT